MPKGELTPKQTRFYVYELVDPRDGRVFYVGKGCGRRDVSHIAEARRLTVGNPRKANKICEIESSGHKVTVRRVHQGLSEPEAYRLERKRIAEIGLKNLTNISRGENTPGVQARRLLARVKPVREWVKEGHRTKADLWWYFTIVNGLLKEAKAGRDA